MSHWTTIDCRQHHLWSRLLWCSACASSSEVIWKERLSSSSFCSIEMILCSSSWYELFQFALRSHMIICICWTHFVHALMKCFIKVFWLQTILFHLGIKTEKMKGHEIISHQNFASHFTLVLGLETLSCSPSAFSCYYFIHAVIGPCQT